MKAINPPALFLYLITLLLSSSCANFSVHQAERPGAHPVEINDPGLQYSLFLAGDAGYISPESKANMLALAQKAEASGKASTVLFLGDNIYPEGMPPKEMEEERRQAEAALDFQIEHLEDYPGKILYIPGNHDWEKGRQKGSVTLRRQEKYIENYGWKNLDFEPDKGCPGPEEIKLTDDVTLLIIDSQWWLQDWDLDKDINQDCDFQTRFDFLTALQEALKKNKEKQVILAMHHPLYSQGAHGGYFRLKDHLFPLTNLNKSLYIPMPVIGSIYPVFRGNYGNIQDIAHPKYYELKRGILDIAMSYENIIFASGHEHNLQYITQPPHHFLVSGSGSKTTAVANGRNLIYGHAQQGFMQLDFYDKGKTVLKIWESTPADGSILVFQKEIVGEKVVRQPVSDISSTEKLPNTVEAKISEEYEKGALYRSLFGEHYRDLYGQKIQVPVMDLQNALGGLTPTKKGGGFQTNSLRLEADDGREYVLRSLNKDATRLLPPVFQGTFAMDILQDQFTASHPYGAFVIPDLASTAGIYHSNPRLVYLPAQPALGEYNQDFADALYLFEERPDEDFWSDKESFGNSSEIMSYGDAIENLLEKHSHQVDQQFTVKSRLFDMFIGDWDRHDDQWRWAAFDSEDGERKYYRPIPRDRDQVFSNYDGILVGLANWYTPTLRKMDRFRDDIRRIKWFNYNARYFDRHFINQMTKEDWLNAAGELKGSLTDERIESAIRSWPEEVYALEGKAIESKLKARRDKLPEFATRYYDVLARTVDIPGTYADDVFDIRWPGEGTVEVFVFDKSKKGKRDELFYHRIFKPGETREVRLFAMDGEDIIRLSGNGRSPILVRVIGGPDKDTYEEVDFSGAKKLKIQDKNSPDRLPIASRKYYRELEEDQLNDYDRTAFEYDYGIPLIAIAANPDDGFLLGGGVQWFNHGFQKLPFASRHSLVGQFAFSSDAFKVQYEGRWTEALRPFDFQLGVLFQGPTFVQNFFGYGNDTGLPDDTGDLEFYRVRIRNFALYPSFIKRIGKYGEIGLKTSVESVKVDKTEGRFITTPGSGVGDDIFEDQLFGGLELNFNYAFADIPYLTRRGIDFDIALGVENELNSGDVHSWFAPSLSMYYQFKYLGKPVLATRIGTEFHGGEFDFYQGAILGSTNNFRGVRKERFTGNKVFYHNTDLRFQVLRLKSYYIPSLMGVLLSFDHGRVWYEDESSDTWHYSYGGGIWISPFQSLVLTLNYHISDVDERFSFGMGFFF